MEKGGTQLDFDCIIIGAGLAGTSVAWHLARSVSNRRILLLEREHAAGTHASAQNAAMIRALACEDSIAPFAMEGARFWNALPEELNWPGMFHQTGSLLLASESETLELLRKRVKEATAAGLSAEIWSAEKCREIFPALADTPFTAAAYCKEDGVGDPQALMDGFLASARRGGAEYRRKCEVETLLCNKGVVTGVQLTSGERINSSLVVLAMGAWSPELMSKTGLDPRGLAAHRRHLYVTGAAKDTVPGLTKETPIVWHLDKQVYLRWETGGILFSACDESPSPPCRPEVDDDLDAFVEERVSQSFPFLLDLPLVNSWAGLRTFTPDHSFVLGREPELKGLFYATGLGGHGVTCAAPAGALVAQQIIEEMNTSA